MSTYSDEHYNAEVAILDARRYILVPFEVGVFCSIDQGMAVVRVYQAHTSLIVPSVWDDKLHHLVSRKEREPMPMYATYNIRQDKVADNHWELHTTDSVKALMDKTLKDYHEQRK